MKKSTLIVIIAIILIIVLAIIVGVEKGKKIENTNTNVSTTTINETKDNVVTSVPKIEETKSPEPVETPSPVITPSQTVEVKDVSKMSSDEKIEYAKSIAQSIWQKVGANISVSYTYEDILSDGTYMIAITNNATTIDYCYVNIQDGTGELERYR